MPPMAATPANPTTTNVCPHLALSSNPNPTLPYIIVVSALRGEPKPGYGLKSSTLPAAGRNGGPAGMIFVSSLRQPPKPGYGFSPRNTFYRQGLGSYSALHGDYSFTGLGEKTQSTEFSSARSDVSAGSLTEADRSALVCIECSLRRARVDNAELCASTTYSSGLRGYTSYSPHLRRSLPNMHHMSSEPPKIYPAHLLFVSNYRLPNDVDRCHLERHLSDAEFEMIFHMSRMDFYRLPEWRRNDLKRRCKLF
ncbi:Actin-binding LIM protein 1 [Penaeus vannamei]|uniref:Actin-binding LIM protein 1 n=1 Tax=Penaeus vannamei TaxID=6689 RepID=A0A3R7LXG9_PENVA|nr:Actin-binding LIM protein 1 [Penaeus vannamei]